MAGVPTEMTFNTTSTVMTSQRDNTMRHDNALPVTCHSCCALHRTMHMSYRSKTYTWNDVILVKRSMIRFFNNFWLKIVPFIDVKKHVTARLATDDNIKRRMRVA